MDKYLIASLAKAGHLSVETSTLQHLHHDLLLHQPSCNSEMCDIPLRRSSSNLSETTPRKTWSASSNCSNLIRLVVSFQLLCRIKTDWNKVLKYFSARLLFCALLSKPLIADSNKFKLILQVLILQRLRQFSKHSLKLLALLRPQWNVHTSEFDHCGTILFQTTSSKFWSVLVLGQELQFEMDCFQIFLVLRLSCWGAILAPILWQIGSYLILCRNLLASDVNCIWKQAFQKLPKLL